MFYLSKLMFFLKLQEPDDPDAPDEHESSPPEDAPLYPHSPGSQYQQVRA